MSTDRELLEMAAKAAGIEVESWTTYGPYVGGLEGCIWNPLKDDGDALRLAVKKSVFEPGYNYASFRLFYLDELRSDKRPSEAMRRAIVRSVAEIGKAMP